MDAEKLAKIINLKDEYLKAAFSVSISEDEYKSEKELFYQNEKLFFANWENKENKYTWILQIYLRMAADVYEIYQSEKISDDIYSQTFRDITIWAEECYRKYGIYGLKEVHWVALSIKMKLFRLGRLQFEPSVLQKSIKCCENEIEKGEKVLNVHIPSGERLDFEECIRSFERAEAFFGKDYEWYMCDSWLLSPELKKLLGSDSNIIRFQELFDIISVHYTYPQAEERVFKDIRDDKENYPKNTSLQRSLKKYILDGNNPGIGVGLVKRSVLDAHELLH